MAIESIRGECRPMADPRLRHVIAEIGLIFRAASRGRLIVTSSTHSIPRRAKPIRVERRCSIPCGFDPPPERVVAASPRNINLDMVGANRVRHLTAAEGRPPSMVACWWPDPLDTRGPWG